VNQKAKTTMSNNETDTNSSYGPDEQDHDQQPIDDLHDRIDAVEQDKHAYRDQFIKPQLNKLEERLDELETTNEQLQETVEQQGQRIEELDHQVENLIGVDDPERSTHDKRVRDVRAAMIRRAEAKADTRSEEIEGKIALSYSEIQNLLADHGHGQVHDPQAYRIMDDIENVDGFTEGTKRSTHGREVKAIRLDLAALPAYARTNDVRSASTSGGGETTPKTAEDYNHG
jgi:dynactin complex subunit